MLTRHLVCLPPFPVSQAESPLPSLGPTYQDAEVETNAIIISPVLLEGAGGADAVRHGPASPDALQLPSPQGTHLGRLASLLTAWPPC